MKDKEVEEYAMQDYGLDLELESHPSNSPDTNVLDLGFCALESLQHQQTSDNLDELIGNVRNIFENYEPYKRNNVFLTLQTVLQEIICHDGTNQFEAPHIGRERMR